MIIIKEYTVGISFILHMTDIVNVLGGLYLTPHLICGLRSAVPIFLAGIFLDDNCDVGLNDILVEHNEIISHDKLGSIPGRFRGIEVDIVLILIDKLELG